MERQKAERKKGRRLTQETVAVLCVGAVRTPPERPHRRDAGRHREPAPSPPRSPRCLVGDGALVVAVVQKSTNELRQELRMQLAAERWERRLDRRAWERQSERRRLRELAKRMAREHETSKKAQ